MKSSSLASSKNQSLTRDSSSRDDVPGDAPSSYWRSGRASVTPAGPVADRRRAAAVGFEKVVDRVLRPFPVVVVAWRVDSQQPAARSEALRFVERAGVRDAVAERGRGAVAVACEKGREVGGGESSFLVQPERHGEVVEGHDGGDSVLVAGVEHPPVVGELGARELALRRLDARPLDTEAEGVEPQGGEHRDVLAVAVIEVARVAGRLPAGGRLDVLPPPPVGVGVVALGLVGRDRGAEQEAFREREDLAHPGQCSGAANREVDKVSGPNYYPEVKPRRTFVLACR